MKPNVLTISGLTKSYPGVQALADASLELHAGEVHALVGENGAGKSTLSRIVSGIVPADAGHMTLRGEPYAPTSRRQAELLGVRIVMQELNLIPTLSVAENIFLDSMRTRFGVIRYRELLRRAAEVMQEVGLTHIDPGQSLGKLGVGQQQMVEIARGLSGRCDVLILDEPTASLTSREIDLLFEHIRRLREAGTAVIYISHRLEEIRQIADRLTVLRDGRVVGTHEVAGITIPEVIRLMVGRELGEAYARPDTTGAVALKVRGLCSGAAVRDVSFDLHQGEILGFAGLVGSGRTETLRAIFGADPLTGGQVFLDDAERPLHLHSPHAAVKQGIALLTEDRKSQGLFLPLSVAANTTITNLLRFTVAKVFRRPAREGEATANLASRLAIRTPSINQAVFQLSGGNQQKVVIAKWLFRDTKILLCDEPTRGIDVGAKFEIYRLLSELAAAGKAIIVVSSDLLELLAICDRIAVMSAGRLVATFRRSEFNQEAILAAALSGYSHGANTNPSGH